MARGVGGAEASEHGCLPCRVRGCWCLLLVRCLGLELILVIKRPKDPLSRREGERGGTKTSTYALNRHILVSFFPPLCGICAYIRFVPPALTSSHDSTWNWISDTTHNLPSFDKIHTRSTKHGHGDGEPLPITLFTTASPSPNWSTETPLKVHRR